MCREFLVYRLARGRHVVLAVTAVIGSGAVSGRAVGKGERTWALRWLLTQEEEEETLGIN